MSIELDIIRAHVKDMLEARGDDVSYIEEHGDAVPFDQYYKKTIILDTDKTVVFYALTKDILAKDWKTDEKHQSHETLLAAYPGKQFILVLSDTPSPANLNKLVAIDKALQSPPNNSALQIFYVKELLYNPMKHTLVPHHEKLSEVEAKEIMDSYLVKQKSQMPVISHNDTIARWLGLKTGDIVRITRYNETSGTYYYYRCCV